MPLARLIYARSATSVALGLRHGESLADQCREALESCLAAGGLQRWRGDLHRVTPNASYHNLSGVI